MAKKPKKQKKPLTAAQRREKKLRKAEFMTVFVGGKQKRIRRPPMIEGLPADEFVRRNADPVWLYQHGYWELIDAEPETPEEIDSPLFNPGTP
ncbi:MAG: hypothetical protein WC205_08980 [Opitutaceae bacterium]|jgi:hypothetical protein